jgi:hypothetical protein
VILNLIHRSVWENVALGALWKGSVPASEQEHNSSSQGGDDESWEVRGWKDHVDSMTKAGL